MIWNALSILKQFKIVSDSFFSHAQQYQYHWLSNLVIKTQ